MDQQSAHQFCIIQFMNSSQEDHISHALPSLQFISLRYLFEFRFPALSG
jgi:hypothetical protein